MAAPEASIPAGEGPLAASLLSEARSRKFDLLLHLAVNLAQPIVVSGPEGMGKTLFLKRLESGARPFAAPCYLAATGATSYEAIVEYLRQAALRELGSNGSAELGFSELMAHYARERRLLILMLDNADLLLPGLLSALWDLARQNPALHLVLALPSQAWARKFATDAPALRDAQPLEIPSLTPAEFAAFLKRLAAEQDDPAAGRALAELGRNTASGNPGAALRLLEPSAPSVAAGNAPKPLRGLWVGGAAVLALLVSGAAWLLWQPKPNPSPPVARSHWSSPGADVNPGASLVLREPAAPTVPPPPKAEETSPPPLAAESAAGVPAHDVAQTPPAPSLPPHQEAPPLPAASPAPSAPAPVAAPQAPVPAPVELAAKAEAAPSSTQSAPPSPPANPPEPLPEIKVLVPAAPAPPVAAPANAPSLTPEQQARVQAASVAIDGVHDAEWLLAQSPETYTLQVVAMSQPQALAQAAKRFPAGSILAAVRARKGKGDLYTLFYGIYPSLAEAKEGAKSLPPNMGTPIPRSFKAVQGDVLRPSAAPAAAKPYVGAPISRSLKAAQGDVPRPPPAAPPAPAAANPLQVPHPAQQP